MPVRPKTYDRPGYREQSMKRREIARLADAEMDVDPYDIFNQLTPGEKAALDPTLGYGVGWQDAKAGRPIRGSSPEYEDGYLSGQQARGETVQ
jgi:hypothetical protein